MNQSHFASNQIYFLLGHIRGNLYSITMKGIELRKHFTLANIGEWKGWEQNFTFLFHDTETN